MRALTHWDAKITSTCTATGQFKGQFKGAMEEMSQKVQNASSHPPTLRTHKVTVKFKGAMEHYTGSIWRENSLRSATTHHEQ